MKKPTKPRHKVKKRKEKLQKPMKTFNLTKEEKDLLASYERGEWRSIKNLKSQMNRYQTMAKLGHQIASQLSSQNISEKEILDDFKKFKKKRRHS